MTIRRGTFFIVHGIPPKKIQPLRLKVRTMGQGLW
nr:MAG TPA: hypothetical protein [Caudoviricetes sp.]